MKISFSPLPFPRPSLPRPSPRSFGVPPFRLRPPSLPLLPLAPSGLSRLSPFLRLPFSRPHYLGDHRGGPVVAFFTPFGVGASSPGPEG